MRRSAAAVTGVVLGVVGLLLAILFSLGQEPAGGVEAGRTAIEPAGSGLIPSATANVELVGQFGGAGNAVSLYGRYGLAGAGPRVLVVDLETGGEPRLVGLTEPFSDIVQGVAPVGHYALIAAGTAGLLTVDLTQPAAPRETAVMTVAGSAVGVVISGTVAYVGTSGEGIVTLDVSRPDRPARLGSYPAGTTRQLQVAGSLLYVAGPESIASILDVSDPSNLRHVAALPIGSPAVTADAEYAYAVTGAALIGRVDLRVYDVRDPARPTQVATKTLFMPYPYASYHVSDLRVLSGTVYIASRECSGKVLRHCESSFHGIPLSGLVTPTRPVTTINGAASGRSTYSGTRFVRFDEFGALASYDIADGPSLVSQRRFEIPTNAVDVSPLGTVVYVADASRGMRTVTGALAGLPAVAASTDQGRDAVPLDRSGSRPILYALTGRSAESQSALGIYDVSNPVSPQRIAQPNDFFMTTSLVAAAGGGHVFVLRGLQIDVYDLNGKRIGGPIRLDAGALTVRWPYLYAVGVPFVARGGTLWTLDVSDVVSPRIVATTTLPSPGLAVSVEGAQAVVATKGDGLIVLDLSDPLSPTVTGQITLSGDLRDVAVTGSTAYIAAGWAGVHVVDLSDSTRPIQIGQFDTPGTAVAVAAACGNVYIADSEGGLAVLHHRAANAAGAASRQPVRSAAGAYSLFLPHVPNGYCEA